MAHDIDMRDPSVKRLLGNEGCLVAPGVASGKRELVQIKGDMDHGLTSTTRLDMGKHEVIVAGKDHVLTVDVYAIVGEPLKVHLICPRCKHLLTIDGARKPIEYDALAENPLGRSILNELPRELLAVATHGKLSIETFQCTWELEDHMQDAGKDDHVIARGSLCRYRAAIDRNVLKEE